jgi:gamma-D-glutamyl-L-lysine dipeptidyl-peptidase
MPKGLVNVSVANLYASPQYASEIVSQVLLGESFGVEQGGSRFSRVLLKDGYAGWLSNYQWVEQSGREPEYKKKRVRSHFALVYEQPDFLSRPVRDAVIGTFLNIVAEQGEWVEVILPDKVSGYISQRCFGAFPVPSREGIKQQALEFLGYPYHWGGRSPRGFDCSGFVQTVCSLLNIDVPRDSWMQHRSGKPVRTDPCAALPGDLYFFADPPGRISHVGIALGGGDIVHARGMVCINSLREGNPGFSQNLADTFVEVRTYIG